MRGTRVCRQCLQDGSLQLDSETMRAAFASSKRTISPLGLLSALAADGAAGQLPPGLLTHAALRLWPALEGAPLFQDGVEASLQDGKLDGKLDVLVGHAHDAAVQQGSSTPSTEALVRLARSGSCQSSARAARLPCCSC